MKLSQKISIVLSIPFLFIIFFLSPIVYNNFLKYRFQISIDEIKLPIKTKQISSYNLFGIIWGGGNLSASPKVRQVKVEKSTYV